MAKPYLSLVVPVRNEAASLLQSLIAMDYALSLAEYSSELIVVDDGSTDATPEISEHFEKVMKTLRTVRKKRAEGSGAAIKTGMAAARGNVRMVLPTRCLGFLESRGEVMAALRGGAGFVVGTRNRPYSREPFGAVMRRVFRSAGNRLLCGKELTKFSDVCFGAFAMREEIAEWLFSFPELSNGREGALELFALAEGNGVSITELSCERCGLCSFCGSMGEWLMLFFRSFRIRSRLRAKHYYRLPQSGSNAEVEV